MARADARTAGMAPLSLQRYVARLHGPDAFGRVLDAAPPEHAREFAETIIPIYWYRTRAFFSLIDAARDVFGPHDFHERYGLAAAEDELKLFHKWALKFTSPTWVVTRGATVWSKHHDTGVWRVEGGDSSMRGALRDFVVHAPYCKVLTGWLTRVGQLTGAANIRIWHPECRANGKAECVFVGQW